MGISQKLVQVHLPAMSVFNIISPFVKSKEIFNVNNIDINAYKSTETSSEVDQTSMNDRIEKLYIEKSGNSPLCHHSHHAVSFGQIMRFGLSVIMSNIYYGCISDC